MDTILGYKAPRVESITDKSFILQKKRKRHVTVINCRVLKQRRVERRAATGSGLFSILWRKLVPRNRVYKSKDTSKIQIWWSQGILKGLASG